MDVLRSARPLLPQQDLRRPS